MRQDHATWLKLSDRLSDGDQSHRVKAQASVSARRITGVSLLRCWHAAKELDDIVLAEKWITGTELTVAVLNGSALPVITARGDTGEFYDFDAKYISDSRQLYVCPCGLPAELESAVQDLAVNAFDVASCRWLGQGRRITAGRRPAGLICWK